MGGHGRPLPLAYLFHKASAGYTHSGTRHEICYQPYQLYRVGSRYNHDIQRPKDCMSVLVQDPLVSAEIIRRRRELGIDARDEVWEGVQKPNRHLPRPGKIGKTCI